MKKLYKNIIVSLVVVSAIAAWSARFYHLNVNAEQPQSKTYQTGDSVPIGNNFFESTDENLNGYEIKINAVKITTFKDYLKENKIKSSPKREYTPKYVYDLDVTIKNKNATSSIDMVNTRLKTNNDSFQVDDELWGLLYPRLKDYTGFRLRPNTQMNMHFPYTIPPSFESYYTLESLKSTPAELLICHYPIKKTIQTGIQKLEIKN